MNNKSTKTFEKGDYVASVTQPYMLCGYVVDYAYIDGWQCVALSHDPLMNDGHWTFTLGLQKVKNNRIQ